MSFLSMCIQTPSTKLKKDSRKHSRGRTVAPALIGQLVPSNISHQPAEPDVRKLPLQKRNECNKPGRSESYHHHHCHTSDHPNCENDSQKSATCSSASNESQYTSGYQTDDGTFEGKMLHIATRTRPANIRMTAVKDYDPCCNEELVLRKGQRVKVLYKNNDWVYAVTKNGEAGYIPYTFVRPSRKYAGYQSEPEYVADTDVYQSGYDTDMPSLNARRYRGARARIGDYVPSYSVHTGFGEIPENQHNGFSQHHYIQQRQTLGSDGSSPLTEVPRTTYHYTSGYTSAVEYPSKPDPRWHPRPAKSLHSIVDADETVPAHGLDHRPTEEKPRVDSFTQLFLEELVVIHNFESQEEDEVSVNKGEKVRVMNADDPFWLWVETTKGTQGFVPRTCCSLGNHPYLQSNSTKRYPANKPIPTRNNRRYYHHQRSKVAARQARTQAKQRFHELARQRNSAQNPVLMDKEEIQRVGSKLIVLMDYTAIEEDEISIMFAEIVYADVLKQAGAERIWAYCPRTDLCGFVPLSLVVPPVV